MDIIILQNTITPPRQNRERQGNYLNLLTLYHISIFSTTQYKIYFSFFYSKKRTFNFKKEKNSSFFILKTSYFILNLPFLNNFTKSLCTSTASILLICTEKPRLAKRLHALYRVLFYLRAPLLIICIKLAINAKKARHKPSIAQKKTIHKV